MLLIEIRCINIKYLDHIHLTYWTETGSKDFEIRDKEDGHWGDEIARAKRERDYGDENPSKECLKSHGE